MPRDKSGNKKRSTARQRRRATRESRPRPGLMSANGLFELRTYHVGALPIVNHFLKRMQLEEFFTQYLPPDDSRCELPTAKVLLVLVRNVLLSREPIYSVGEWASRFASDLFDLWDDEVAMLGDDRIGRALYALFVSPQPELLLDFVRHVTTTFKINLDELHNDSTTVSFYGAYAGAAEEQVCDGRTTPAITWGHSKARRPDLKQLLYTLTISSDGGVPIYFTTYSGNTADDVTHIATWDLLCQITGRRDFLYVADCKLASLENLTYMAVRGGRFVTVLPRTQKEDREFRDRLRSNSKVTWEHLFDVKDDHGDLVDRWSVYESGTVTEDGFRLLWYHSTRKATQDVGVRQRRIAQTVEALSELKTRLAGPRTRFRQRLLVEQAVERVMSEHEAASLLTVQITQHEEETFRQAKPGRPTSTTPYVRQTRDRYDLVWELNLAEMTRAACDDGVFPLLTNDRNLTAAEVLRAYKRQPVIEKRFSQFKTDYEIAPVYLQNVERIAGLLAVYFFALMVQSLMERELRRAMAAAGIASLPLYPEGRLCARPTANRVIELLEPIQRHVIEIEDGEPHVMVTTLTAVQRQVIELYGLVPDEYGH